MNYSLKNRIKSCKGFNITYVLLVPSHFIKLNEVQIKEDSFGSSKNMINGKLMLTLRLNESYNAE